MLSENLFSLVQFCAQWIGGSPFLPKLITVLIIIQVLVGGGKKFSIRKTGKDSGIIHFH